MRLEAFEMDCHNDFNLEARTVHCKLFKEGDADG
jgi:hypothetical protein